MVSMKEIAKKCNVSVATVSKALNDYPDIGEETKALIQKTAESAKFICKGIENKKKLQSGRAFCRSGSQRTDTCLF